jgi:hypothetical protein
MWSYPLLTMDIFRHCQVIEIDIVIKHTGISLWASLPLCRPLRARYFGPTLESLRHLLTVRGRRLQMRPGSEVLGNESIRRQKSLGMPRGFEPLHATLSLTRRPMRVLTPIIKIR